MKPIQHILTCLTVTLLLCTPVQAAPNFDTSNLSSRLKELVKQESRNKMMKYGKEYMELANNFIALTETLKKELQLPDFSSMTKLEEWTPIVPKNVAPLLVIEDKEKGEPDLDKVQKEVEKVVYLNIETNETLRRSREQQELLLLKTLAFAYAAANRSLELSANGEEENEEMRKQIENTKDALGLYGQMIKLQLFSTRKMYEILHLKTRSLEIHSALGLLDQEVPVDVSNMTTSTAGATIEGTTAATQTSSDATGSTNTSSGSPTSQKK